MQADNLLLVTHLKSLKWIGSSFPSQLWLRLANWLKSSWCVYSHIKGQTTARARAFESYHAKTIFIKATCYHYISSSPNPYIIVSVFQSLSQLSALFSSWQRFCWELEDVVAGFLCKEQGSPQLSHAQKEMGHITLLAAIKHTEEGLGGGRDK